MKKVHIVLTLDIDPDEVSPEVKETKIMGVYAKISDLMIGLLISDLRNGWGWTLDIEEDDPEE